jgi:hypothetical protein
MHLRNIAVACIVAQAGLPAIAEEAGLPETAGALLAGGARRLSAPEIRSLATGKLMVTRHRGLTETQLRLKDDGSISGSIQGIDGTSNGWGKWWVADAGFLCLELHYGFGWDGRGCHGLYEFNGAHYSAARRGPTNTEPPPDATVLRRTFAP